MRLVPRPWWAPFHYRAVLKARHAKLAVGRWLLGMDGCVQVWGLEHGAMVPAGRITPRGSFLIAASDQVLANARIVSFGKPSVAIEGPS